MKKATVLVLIGVLAFASTALAGKGKRDKNGALNKKIITVEPNASTYTSVDYKAQRIKPRTKGASIRKTAAGTKLDFPVTSVYDYGWSSGIRDFVDVSDNGNVHLTVFVRPQASVDERRPVYWYNPGVEGEELFTPATEAEGFGWSNVQVLSDGRATIVYHIDDMGVLVDQAKGIGLFVNKPTPVTGVIWMHHQVGSDDVIWYATNAWGLAEAPGSSTRVWTSSDDGSNWTEVTTIDKSATHSRGPAEPVIRVSPDATEVLVKNEWDDGQTGFGAALSSTDQTTYAWSDDSGTTWNEVVVTFDPYITGKPNPTLVADVFMSAAGAGTADTLIVENFGQSDITYDWEGNVHMIMNGYSWHWDATAGETQFAWPQLHYSSVRGELAANFVEVSDPTMSHSDWLDEAVAAGKWAGNNIGIGYPTISAIDNGPGLMAVWCQPQQSGGVPTIIGGFMVNDLWTATSNDGGDTWTAPVKLTNTPTISEVFPTLGKPLETTGNADEYRYHLVYMEDHLPGTWVFEENDPGLAQWVYLTDLFNIDEGVVGIADENVISAKSFALEQNYPNPFNPRTTIVFTLDKKSDVKLTIFNILGQEVATLVDEVRNAGNYPVIWDASNVASGVYFYKLSAGDLTHTKKMVLLK